MYAVEKVSSLITRGVYTVSGPFHPFGGAVDIIVVQQEDGSFKSSPWYVRFGKFQGVLKTREKIVNIAVNGAEAGFHMYLDRNGEAFFLRDADPNAEGGEFVVSPASSGDEREDQMQNSQLRKSKSTTFDSSDVAADVGVGRIVTRTSSRRTTILERVFGQRSGKGNAQAMDRVNSLERAEIAAELLETKWSTNLSTRRSRTGGPNDRPSKSNVMDASNGDQGAVAEMVLRENGFDHSEAWASNYENVNGESSSPPGGRDSSEDGNNHCLASARVEEESIEIYTHETGDLTGTITPTTDQPRSEPPLNGLGRINSSDESIDSHHELIDNSEGVARGEILIEEVTSNGIVGIHTIEAGTMNDKNEVGSQFVTVDSDGPDLNYSDADSPSCDATDVASEIHAVQLLAYSQDASQEQVVVISSSETMESLNVVSGIMDEKVHDGVQLVECSETADVSLTGGGQLEELLEDSIEKCGQSISKERPLSYNNDSSNKEYMKKLDVQDQEIFVVEYSNSQIYEVNCPDKNVFVDVIANDHSTNSAHDLACGQDLVFPDSSSRVIEVLGSAPENVHREDVSMNSTGENETCKADVEASCTQTSMEEVETMECITPSASFLDEIASESVSNVCESSNLSKDVEAQDIIIGDDANKSCSMDGAEFGLVSGAISIHREAAEAVVSFSDIVQEMQFQFSDTESFVDRDTMSDMTANEETVMGEHGELVSSGDYAEEQEGNNINHEKNSENCSDSSRLETSSIPIPGSKLFLEDDTLEASSLPNLRSHIHDLERSDSLQLSRSLGSNAENSGVDSVSTTNFGFSELAPEGTSDSEENNDAPELARNAAPDHKHADGLKVELFNPFVELSLCKHLLYEGMGEDAARKAFDSEKVTLEKFRAMRQSLIKTNKLAVRIAGHYFPWDVAAPIVLGMVSFREEQVFEPPQGMIKVEQVGAIVASSGSWRIWPFSFRRARTVNTVRSVRESSDNDSFTPPDKVSCGESNKLTPKKVERKVRSLTPTSEELASLNLREGRNVVTFTFSTAMLGRQQVDARVYLWKWNTRIVISDVDGTITKSDVLGQFMPLVGVDWSQTGVAHLFSAIKENGYQLLFLSARAISQAHLTRQFLFNLKQDGKALPDGPVVISPDGLFPSLYREVIRRAPHEFKISCLEVIKALFPSGSNPFYAGFGNRDTDELSYLKVGIPMGKIFIINPKGEVAVNRRVDTKSYSSLHALVNRMFPPSSCEQEDYNSWNYWKMPLPSVDN